MLAGEFKMPWNFLAEIPLHARAGGAGGLQKSADKLWWSLYQKVRTHFQQNPD
jgi:hypothetical protein